MADLPWWSEELHKKRQQVINEQVSSQVREQGAKLGLDMSVLEQLE